MPGVPGSSLWPLNPMTRALVGRSHPFDFCRSRAFLIGSWSGIGSGFSIVDAEPAFQPGHESSKLLHLGIQDLAEPWWIAGGYCVPRANKKARLRVKRRRAGNFLRAFRSPS